MPFEEKNMALMKSVLMQVMLISLKGYLIVSTGEWCNVLVINGPFKI
jgi:hypothetical protein